MLLPTDERRFPMFDIPTSSEVGIQKLNCRQQHQEPTSHEVGMQKREAGCLSVGNSIKNPLLTKWVCRNARQAACL